MIGCTVLLCFISFIKSVVFKYTCTCIHYILHVCTCTVPYISLFLGAVYRGKYRNEHVAIKEFLTQAQAESGYDEFDDMGAQQAHQVQLYYSIIQCTHYCIHTCVILYHNCDFIPFLLVSTR